MTADDADLCAAVEEWAEKRGVGFVSRRSEVTGLRVYRVSGPERIRVQIGGGRALVEWSGSTRETRTPQSLKAALTRARGAR